ASADFRPSDAPEPPSLAEPPSIPLPPSAPSGPPPVSTPPTHSDAEAAEQRVREKVAQVRFEEQRIRAEADRRMQEAQRLQPEAAAAPTNTFGEPPAPEPAVASAADPAISSQGVASAALPAADFSFAEQQLQAGREARQRSMAEAEQRLHEIDERTKVAEER